MSIPHIAEVAIPLPVADSYDYHIPEALAGDVQVGKRVFVPFGSKRLTGYVVGLKEQSVAKGLKDILDVLDDVPVFDAPMLVLCRWVGRYYLCPLGEVMRSVLPAAGTWRERGVVKASGPGGFQPAGPKARALLALLEQKGKLTFPQIKKALGTEQIHAMLRGLEKDGAVSVRSTVSRKRALTRSTRCACSGSEGPDLESVICDLGSRDISDVKREIRQSPLALTDEQTQAMSILEPYLQGDQFRPFLLHGVTGSGKTEVYLRCARELALRGRQSIILVPEVSLAPQTVERFRDMFGDRIAVLHSYLGGGEWDTEWGRVRDGLADVVIGARSAVFAPVPRLGMIVLDEEQESAYKQGESPRYHARAAAMMRAKQAGALVLLGSATPSLESTCYAEQGRYALVPFTRRIAERPLPEVVVVDMRSEAKRTGRTLMISERLKRDLGTCLAAGEQALLLLNRRGFAPFVLCTFCGEVIRCPACSVTLTLHQPTRSLKCHYCQYEIPLPETCPVCHESHLEHKGYGIQQVEQEVQKLFPKAKVDRMDLDTTRRKGAHAAILDKFRRGDTQILVGTQMIAKGLDFPGVTLVGVVSADTGLHFPDFRSAERTFQLLTQVAGRAGRGDKPGRVLVQTYTPDHYAIQAALRHDTTAFYRQEIRFRRDLAYPPFSRIAQIVVKSRSESAAQQAAQRTARYLDAAARRVPGGGIQVLGPAPCVLSRLMGYYRWQVMIKGLRMDVFAAFCQTEAAAARLKAATGNVAVTVDVDPVNMA